MCQDRQFIQQQTTAYKHTANISFSWNSSFVDTTWRLISSFSAWRVKRNCFRSTVAADGVRLSLAGDFVISVWLHASARLA